uniref:Uncharacterized protein n=2 Tax=Cannabis sativa TaxID=3483 RepID=A0A803PN83_CANSA
MDIRTHCEDEISEDVTRELLIAISYSLPEKKALDLTKSSDSFNAVEVLSDENKRFTESTIAMMTKVLSKPNQSLLCKGMGDFLSEMAVMMSQTKPNESGEETFEELQQLFEDMFQGNSDKRSSTDMNNGIGQMGMILLQALLLIFRAFVWGLPIGALLIW